MQSPPCLYCRDYTTIKIQIQAFFVQNIHNVTLSITICSVRQISQKRNALFVQKDNIAITIDNHYKLILPTALIYQPIMNKSRTSEINGNMSQKIKTCSKILFKNSVYISFLLLYNKH